MGRVGVGKPMAPSEEPEIPRHKGCELHYYIYDFGESAQSLKS